MVTYKIDLDITPGGIPKIVHVKQYQTDATLEFKLHTRRGTLNIGNVTDCSIRGTKTDGNGYSASAEEFVVSTNTVRVNLTSQMTAVAGRQPYEITVTDSTGKMITATFYLDVQRSALDEDTISASDIREITNALDHTDDILQAAQDVSDAADRIEQVEADFEETVNTLVDPTLSGAGKAAEAKVTGDRISALENIAVGVIRLESGGINDSTGEKESSTVVRRIRSVSKIPTKNIYSITIPDGYALYLYYFDEDQVYLGLNGWHTGTIKPADLFAGYDECKLLNLLFKKVANPNDDISGDVEVVESGLIITTALQKTNDTVDDILGQINELYNIKTFDLTGGWTSYEFDFVTGKQYYVTSSTSSSTIYASANGSSNTTLITKNEVFTPSSTTHYIRVWGTDGETITIEEKQTIIDDIKDDVNDLNSEVTSLTDGFSKIYDSFVESEFEKGAIDSGSNSRYREDCRIRTKVITVLPYDLTVTILSDHTSVVFYSYIDGVYNESHTINALNTSYTVPANTEFRFFVDGCYGWTVSTLSIAEILTKIEIQKHDFENVYANINSITKVVSGIPSYYFDDNYLDNKALIAQKRTGVNGPVFGFISDVHTGDSGCRSMSVAKYISNKTSALPYMIFGGDVPETNTGTFDGMYEQAMKWQEMMGDFGKHKVYQCRGNHDYLTAISGTSYKASYDVCRNFVTANLPLNIIPSGQGTLSYYFDDEKTKTRTIVLDEYSVTTGDFSGYVGLSASEYNWFVDVALNVNNYNVILVVHEPLNLKNNTSYNANLDLLGDIVSAFKTHGTVHGSWGQAVIDKDFSSNTSNLIAVLSGHKHMDFVGNTKDFVTIGITSDATYGSGRSLGNITEGAFDTMAFDYTNKKVYCTRFGFGNDRIIHLDFITEAVTLTCDTAASAVLWESDDIDVATVSGGSVTFVGSGTCVITATYDDITEIWSIKN